MRLRSGRYPQTTRHELGAANRASGVTSQSIWAAGVLENPYASSFKRWSTYQFATHQDIFRILNDDYGGVNVDCV